MQARWQVGYFLGKLWKSDEHILAVDDNIIKARAIRALPNSESWDAEALQDIKATPWSFKKNEQDADDHVEFVPG